MKIKWGALVVDGRGKLGGHVASQNKGGSHLRTKVTPSNPQTIFQSGVRAIWGAISAGWSGLTGAQILAWNSAVAEWKETNIFGDIKQPSGKALYQKLNQELLTSDQAGITSPPAKLEMVQGVVTGALVSISGETIEFDDIYNGADANIKVFASGPVSAGTTFVKNLMRQIYTGIASSVTQDASSYARYVEKYGAPVAGQKVYLGVKYVLPNGQASPMQTILATVVA